MAYALWRRFVTRPARLTYTRDAMVILLMIGGLVTAELVAGIFESAALRRPAGCVRRERPRRRRCGSVDPAILQAGFAVAWWTHIVLVSAFLRYLPFSKHLHIATSVFNVYFAQARAARRSCRRWTSSART